MTLSFENMCLFPRRHTFLSLNTKAPYSTFTFSLGYVEGEF